MLRQSIQDDLVEGLIAPLVLLVDEDDQEL